MRAVRRVWVGGQGLVLGYPIPATLISSFPLRDLQTSTIEHWDFVSPTTLSDKTKSYKGLELGFNVSFLDPKQFSDRNPRMFGLSIPKPLDERRLVLSLCQKCIGNPRFA